MISLINGPVFIARGGLTIEKLQSKESLKIEIWKLENCLRKLHLQRVALPNGKESFELRRKSENEKQSQLHIKSGSEGRKRFDPQPPPHLFPPLLVPSLYVQSFFPYSFSRRRIVMRT